MQWAEKNLKIYSLKNTNQYIGAKIIPEIKNLCIYEKGK
jgi:hypothetical protein